MEVSGRGSNARRSSGGHRNQVESHRQVGDCHRVPAMTRRTTMVCDICGEEGARIRRVSRSYGKGENLLVIENVPVVSCPHCGESYLTGKTLHELERIKSQRRSASKRSIPVAQYA